MYQEKYIPPKGPYPPPDLENQRFSDKQKTNKAMKQNTTREKLVCPSLGLLDQKSLICVEREKRGAKWSRFYPNPLLIVRPHTASLAVPCGQRQYWEELCPTPPACSQEPESGEGGVTQTPKKEHGGLELGGEYVGAEPYETYCLYCNTNGNCTIC